MKNKQVCEDCGIELTNNEEDVCDRCDFRRNYPEMSKVKADKLFWKNYKKGGHNRCHKKKF